MWKMIGSYLLKGALWALKNHPKEVAAIAVAALKKDSEK